MMKVFNRGYLVGLVLLGVLAGPYLLAKPLLQWPLEIVFESKSPKNVDVPAIYEIVFRQGKNGPVQSFNITLKIDRDLKYSGQTQWSVDFKGKDEFRIPIEVMIGKNDTGGIVLDLQVVYESGLKVWQPDQLYFLPAADGKYRTQDDTPPQVTPKAWVEIYGSREQKDSMLTAEFYRGQKEWAEKHPQPTSSTVSDSGVVTIRSFKYEKRFQDKLWRALQRLIEKESTSPAVKEIEYAVLGKVILARAAGELKWRFWQPLPSSVLDSLDLLGVRLDPLERFVETQVLYLLLPDSLELATAKSIVPQLRKTDMEHTYEVEVNLEVFKLIIQNKLRFEKNIYDIVVPEYQDTTQGSIDFDDHSPVGQEPCAPDMFGQIQTLPCELAGTARCAPTLGDV